MFHGEALGKYTADDTGTFVATDAPEPDSLRVVVTSLAPTSTVYLRVLTAGVPNTIVDFHNPALLATKVGVASVTDASGTVLATSVSVAPVSVPSGAYTAYKLTLARTVEPATIVGASIHPYLATPVDLPVTSVPRIELAGPVVSMPAWAPTTSAWPAYSSGGHRLIVGYSWDVPFTFPGSTFDSTAVAAFTATAV